MKNTIHIILSLALLLSFTLTSFVTVAKEQQEPLVMINVFTPTSGTQEEVIRSIQAGLGESVSKLPGFIKATVHKSRDNNYVVVYALWKDQNAVNNAIKVITAGGAPAMAQAFTIADPDFHPYDVMSIHLKKD